MRRFSAKDNNNQDIGLDVYANKGNANAQVLKYAIIKDRYEQEADTHAEADTQAEEVPVSFQRQKQEDGETVTFYVRERYQLLSSYYMWEYLRDKYLKHVVTKKIRVARKPPSKPSLSAFRAILIKECPNIKVQSPRDNVCDQCVIYSNSLGSSPVVGETENMPVHVKKAVVMR